MEQIGSGVEGKYEAVGTERMQRKRNNRVEREGNDALVQEPMRHDFKFE